MDTLTDREIQILEADTEQEYSNDEMWLKVGTCPDCDGLVYKTTQANGPDDFDWLYQCLGCGNEWS